MKLFAGLETTDYQDVLRAVGKLIDDQGLRDVRIWEHENGLIVQGLQVKGSGNGYDTYLLTDDDLHALLRSGYSRRGMPGQRLSTGS